MPRTQPDPVHDLAIVGAGPAGGALALCCARLGLKVALIDARETGGERQRDTRNFAIVRGSWNLLEFAGLTETLAPLAEPLNGLEATDGAPHLFGAPGVLFTGADLPGEAGGTLGYMVEAEDLQAAIDTALAGSEAITHLIAARFERLYHHQDCIEAELQDGRRLRARLLVGCDGLNSPVRAAAGIGTEGRNYDMSVLAADVRLTRPHGGIARQLFTPHGPFATLPLRGDRANLAWYMRGGAPEVLAARPAEEITAELNARFAAFAGEMEIDGPVKTYPLILQLATSMIADRVALVGDAARRINPLAGQGLNLGFKDVAALAEVCSDQLRAGLDPGDPLALARYQDWRRPDATATALGMDMIERTFSNDNVLLKPLRGLALGLADRVGPLRRALARQASAAQSSLPRLMQEASAGEHGHN